MLDRIHIWWKSRQIYGIYKIRFKKISFEYSALRHKEVSDCEIIKAINNAKCGYTFEIINVNLKDASTFSQITFKCMRRDRLDIFNIFCSELAGYITEIKLK